MSTGRTPVFTLTPGDPDLRPVGPGDPTMVASFINPTIDAGIFDPLVDGSVPTTTVMPTTRPLPALPSTGSDVGHIALIALLALLAGVAFVAASRRRGSDHAGDRSHPTRRRTPAAARRGRVRRW